MPPAKRKASIVSPYSNTNRTANKRAKLSPGVTTATQPISVIEARRNVQSTESLLAAMGMEKFLSSTVEKRPEEPVQINGLAKSEPIPIPSIQSAEKRGRKKREPKLETQQAPVVPRLKIRFGGKSIEEHNAEEMAKKNGLLDAKPSTSNAEPATSRRQSVGKKSNAKAQPKSEFSWYDKLPSIEELDLRSQRSSATVFERPDTPTEPVVTKCREREIILMPYLESDEPDFLMYNYPDKERFMVQKRRF